MRYITLLILPLIIFTACRKNNRLRDEYIYSRGCTYQEYYRIDSTLQTSSGKYFYNTVPDSNKIVFQYEQGRDIRNADDAASGYGITFQVDYGVQSFVYTDAQLKQHLTYYQSYEGWGGSDQMLIDKGIISGQKQADGTWQIGIGVGLPKTDDILNISSVNDNIIATKYPPL